MNLEISNETYLKFKNEIFEIYPKISDEEIQMYLVDYMDEMSVIRQFGNFVCMKEKTLREKNSYKSIQCDECEHVFIDNEEYYIVYEGKAGEEKLCKECFDSYKYGKVNVKKYIYGEK